MRTSVECCMRTAQQASVVCAHAVDEVAELVPSFTSCACIALPLLISLLEEITLPGVPISIALESIPTCVAIIFFKPSESLSKVSIFIFICST